MKTMNIAIPETLRAYVRRQVKQRGYSSVSEYLRTLIRADLKQESLAHFETDILKGLESGPATLMTHNDWQEIRKEVKRRSAKHA